MEVIWHEALLELLECSDTVLTVTALNLTVYEALVSTDDLA